MVATSKAREPTSTGPMSNAIVATRPIVMARIPGYRNNQRGL